MIVTTIATILVWLTHAYLLPPVDVVTVSTDGGVFGNRNTTIVMIWIDVREGYHIQASRVIDDSLIPTTVELSGEGMVVVRRLRYPRPKRFKLDGADSLLMVYDGKFPVKMWLALDAHAEPGAHIVKARLRYQACDARTCLFPRVVEFEIPLEISPGVR